MPGLFLFTLVSAQKASQCLLCSETLAGVCIPLAERQPVIHTIVHNVLFPDTLEISAMLFPCSDIQACLPESAGPELQPPAPGITGQAGGWAPTAAARRCSCLLGELHPEGTAEAKLTCKQSVLPSISLYPGQWLLVSVSLKCRAITFIYPLYLDQM